MPVHQRQRGQVLVLFVLAFIALVLVVGLVIDGSFAWVKRRQAQNAADFAALAGAQALKDGGNDAEVAAAVLDTAQANGATITLGGTDGPAYTDAKGASLDVAVGGGSIPSGASGVQVQGATVSWHPFIIGIVGINDWSAGAEATARFTLGTSAPPCSLCVLNGIADTGSGSITTDGAIRLGGTGGFKGSGNLISGNGDIFISGAKATGSGKISAPNGSIYINGDYNDSGSGPFSAGGSVYITGSATLKGSQPDTAGGSVMIGSDLKTSGSGNVTAGGVVATGGSLTLTGSASIKAGAAVRYVDSYSKTGSGSVVPSPQQVSPFTVTVPTATDCTGATVIVADPYLCSYPDAVTATVQQAFPLYPSGLTLTTVTNPGSPVVPTKSQLMDVTVSGSTDAILNPGVYKSLRCKGSGSCTLKPGTYYFDGSATALQLTGSGDFIATGGVTLVFLNSSGMSATGSGALTLEAPSGKLSSSTTYPWPGMAIVYARADSSALKLTGSGDLSLDGILYAAGATFQTTGSGTGNVTTTIVVGQLKTTGSGDLSVNAYTDIPPDAPGPVRLVH